MDTRRQELNRDAPRSGWRYHLHIVAALAPLWWVPALVVVAVMLLINGF